MFFYRMVSSYKWGDIEILIQKFDDPNMERYVFYDFLRTHTLQGDYWVHRPFLAEGQYIILDMADYTLKMVSKTNIMYLRDYLLFMLVSVFIFICIRFLSSGDEMCLCLLSTLYT